MAGVVLPVGYKNDEINDSKLLSAAKRQKLFDVIIKDAVWYQITFVPAVDVDKYNPKQATINGMKKIIEKCNPKPDVALIDAEKIQNCKIKTYLFYQVGAVASDILFCPFSLPAAYKVFFRQVLFRA